MKCEKCGEKMQHIYTIDYKLTNMKNEFYLCQNVECQHCIKSVSYNMEVCGKEKDHVLEARSGMFV